MEKGERWKLHSLQPLGLIPPPSTSSTKRERGSRDGVKSRSGFNEGERLYSVKNTHTWLLVCYLLKILQLLF